MTQFFLNSYFPSISLRKYHISEKTGYFFSETFEKKKSVESFPQLVLRTLFLDPVLTSSTSVFLTVIQNPLSKSSNNTVGSLDGGQCFLYAGCQFSCEV